MTASALWNWHATCYSSTFFPIRCFVMLWHHLDWDRKQFGDGPSICVQCEMPVRSSHDRMHLVGQLRHQHTHATRKWGRIRNGLLGRISFAQEGCVVRHTEWTTVHLLWLMLLPFGEIVNSFTIQMGGGIMKTSPLLWYPAFPHTGNEAGYVLRYIKWG